MLVVLFIMKDLNKRNKYLPKKVVQPVENDWEEDVYSETTNSKWYDEVGLISYVGINKNPSINAMCKP